MGSEKNLVCACGHHTSMHPGYAARQCVTKGCDCLEFKTFVPVNGTANKPAISEAMRRLVNEYDTVCRERESGESSHEAWSAKQAELHDAIAELEEKAWKYDELCK